jgi:nitrate/TMAO reductase-like tetraheme cytochrome c subunit
MKRKIVVLISLIVLAYLGFLFTRLSDRPEFCASCHFMKPYVENWQASSHNRVNCRDCHWAPGFASYIGGKARLLSEILKYFAGAYNVRVHSKVKDEACLSCHRGGELSKPVKFKGKIPFSHDVHYGDTLRNIKIPCTGCHYELVQGSHLAVTDDPCFICHFVGRPPGRPVNDCYTCHGPPKEEIYVNGILFKHSEYLQTGVSCLTCHIHVTRGKGDIPREACYKCHIERFEAYGEIKRVHSVHVTREKYKCVECHNPLEHSQIEMAKALSPDCRTCHKESHSVQEKLYMGLGGKGVSPKPDPMFTANVFCLGCHSSKEYRFATEVLPLARATGQSCVDCHGKGYDKLLTMWQKTVGRRLNKIEKEILFLEPIAKKLGIKGLSDAKENFKLIKEDKSLGAHNINYTVSLLDYAEFSIEKVKNTLLGKNQPVGSTPNRIDEECKGCHPDAAEYAVKIEGREFLHRPHLEKFKCIKCHSKKRHGKTLKRNCDSCHHRKSDDCESCHTIQSLVYTGKLGGLNTPDIMFEAGVSCSDCHIKDGFPKKPAPEDCFSCHDEGYDKIMEEWKKESMEKIDLFESSLKNYRKRIKDMKGKELRKALSIYLSYSSLLDSLKNDGSEGIHNFELYSELLSSWDRLE